LSNREILTVLEAVPTLEGAGVALRRAFGNRQTKLLDPFLLMDDFGSEDPEDYIKGFPWHPHRGIETITYVVDGKVKHEDSLGNGGVIKKGEVQWMTAGSGIVHQEMPELPDKNEDGLWGFQLWANLPKSNKMMDPRYRDVKRTDIPHLILDSGVELKIISGEYNGVKGPVQDVIIKPQYIDIFIPKETTFSLSVPREHTVFNYIMNGSANFGNEESNIGAENLVIYKPGEEVSFRTEEENVRLLLVSGKPLNEPIAWYGPIVMNTQDEIYTAIDEFNNGRFLKNKKEI
jgi:hypothetical protein